jgi:hypothetical protein
MNNWLKRLELLKSLDLGTLAAELNARRGPVKRDKRAAAGRMRRALVAIHEIVRNDRSWVVSMEVIAREMGASENTARRAVLDLEEACLVEVVRRQRARRRGGQGPSEYRLVWPNLLDLAATQGVQRGLFEGGDAPAEPGVRDVSEEARPEDLSGRRDEGQRCGGAPSQSGGAPSHCDRAPSHCDRAPSHCDRAPSHCGSALSSARAPAPLSNPSFHPPPLPDGGEDFSLAWKTVRKELAAYGVATHRQAAAFAGDRGWSPEQIRELLAQCLRQTIDGVRAYGPGAVHRHLMTGEPGTPMRLAPSDAYNRAKRDRERQQAERRARERARQSEDHRSRKRDGEYENPLEAEWGAVLDRAGPEEIAALFEAAALTDFQRRLALREKCPEKPVRRFGAVRPLLLEALAAQEAGRSAGGAHDG